MALTMNEKIGCQPTVSIVIPVYNQEKYIEECINSILEQSFLNYEVVLVNDACTDETFSIVESLVKKDARFKIISYESNKGTSQARKDAVLATTGKYILFVDPDDSLHKDACKTAVENIEKKRVDILQFGTNVVNCGVNEKSCELFVNKCEPYAYDITRDTLFFACFEETLFNFNLWNKIYDADMARKAFSCVKDGYYPKAQDMYAFALMAYFAKSYSSISTKLYNYNFGRGITGSRNIKLDRFYKVSTQMHIIEQLYKFIDRENVDDTKHYTDVLKHRGQIFFNEVYANFTYIEDLEENKEAAIKCFIEGMAPVEDEPFKNSEIYQGYLDAVFTYFDQLYYEKNLDCAQLIFDFALEFVRENKDLNINSLLVEEVKSLVPLSEVNKPIIPVVFATNNNYAPYLSATIASLIEHASRDYVYDLYVFHTSLSDVNQYRIRSMATENVYIRTVNVLQYVKGMRDYSHSHYSVEMYYRILIPEVLNQYSRAVYLDCDLVLQKDVAELYNVDLGDNIVAAVINDIVSQYMKDYLYNTLNIGLDEYFNSGVLVINIEEFKKNGIKEKCFDLLNEYKKLTCPDQDILNLSCRGRVAYLSNEWNYQVGSGAYSLVEKYLKNPAIIHYTTGSKPWNTQQLELGEPFWRYAKLTPFYEDILSGYLNSTLRIESVLKNASSTKKNAERNVINEFHKPKRLITWPFRMMRAFFKSLSDYGFKPTMSKVRIKLKYAFGRMFGRVDRYNNPIRKNKNASPFIHEIHKDELYYSSLPVEKYDAELEEWYNKKTGSNMDIENPVTFNEKIQWLKIHDATLEKSHLSDKWLAKEYIRSVLGDEYIVKTLGVYESFDEINFEELPDKFVIKSTHGSGHVIIVRDKSKMDLEQIRIKTTRWLSKTYGFNCGFEVHYCNIIPRIIIEEYMEGIKDDLYDYKFMCLNGKVEFIWVDVNRFVDHRRNLYDTEWNLLSDKLHWKNSDEPVPKPEKLDMLINLSEKLAKDFACVRCDFYILPDGTVKFGELTFTSASGIDVWNPEAANLKFGEKLILPQPKPFKKLSKKDIVKSEQAFLKELNGGS